jgi:hypothetical protein
MTRVGVQTSVVVALFVGPLLTVAAQSPPDVIRVTPSRNDSHVAGVGVGLTFDPNRVAKAMADSPVTLPDPLPPGAVVGFNSADDVFVIASRAESGDGAVLVVDANMNRDLRDDAPAHVPRRASSQRSS